MKNLVFAFALLFSTSLVAQFSYNSTNPTGIESNTNTASGNYSTAMGYDTNASGNWSTAMGYDTNASGVYSTAMGASSEASGSVSTAMGYETQASGYNSTAMGEYTTASGTTSTAMGYATEASGFVSTAMGEGTTASGTTSTAMGDTTTASEISSTAMGQGTTASGVVSTAIGLRTKAQDFGTTAIGVHNETKETPNPSTFSYQNTAFVIGNGGFDSNGIYDGHLSNAFEVLFDGTTTITGKVTAPAFIGDGSQLTNLPTPSVNYSDITNVPLSFNATSETGIQSATNTASGNTSTAMGVGTIASGYASTAMGEGTTASGFISTAMGEFTFASGRTSTAMGRGTLASGPYSTAMGWNTNAQDFASMSIGQYNKTDETPNPDSFSYQNTAFVIGNGGYDSEGNYVGTSDTFSNAFEVLFDGTTTIAGDLNINSDARLKANIISLGATLSKLLQIDGKTYTMKKDANHKKKIGLLAQDIEKVFPELVSETNDIKSVNYQGLVPVLINAMKEQDDKINKQQQEIERLKKQEAKLSKQQQEIDELKAMVMALAKG